LGVGDGARERQPPTRAYRLFAAKPDGARLDLLRKASISGRKRLQSKASPRPELPVARAATSRRADTAGRRGKATCVKAGAPGR
jgi:hypothetical protein